MPPTRKTKIISGLVLLPMILLAVLWGYVLSWTEQLPKPIVDCSTNPAECTNIRGRVHWKDSGAPVSGVPISAYIYTGNSLDARYDERDIAFALKTFSDVNGVFEVGPLPSGSYILKRGNLPGAVLEGDMDWVRVALSEGENAEGITYRLRRSVAVSGRVVDTKRKPIPHAVVSHGFKSSDWECSTDANGCFVMDGFSVGFPIVLRANAPGFVEGSPEPQQGVFRQAAPPGGLQDVEFVLEPSCPLRGTIVWEDGTPIAEAIITTQPPGGFSGRSCESDSAGNFILELDCDQRWPMNLFALRHGLLSFATGEISWQVNAAEPLDPVRLVASKKPVPRANLWRTVGRERQRTQYWGTIQGRVVDAGTGSPVPRFRVSTGAMNQKVGYMQDYDVEPMDFSQTVYDRAGEFELPIEYEPPARVFVTAEGYASAHVDSTNDVDPVLVRMEKEQRVECLLVDDEDKPAPHVAMLVYQEALENEESLPGHETLVSALASNADGRLSIGGLNPAIHTLEVGSHDYVFQLIQVVPRTEPGEEERIRVVRKGYVTGQVTLHGQPVFDVEVNAARQTELPHVYDHGTALTVEDGTFVMEPLTPGIHTLYVRINDCAPDIDGIEQIFEVRPGKTTIVNADF